MGNPADGDWTADIMIDETGGDPCNEGKKVAHACSLKNFALLISLCLLWFLGGIGVKDVKAQNVEREGSYVHVIHECILGYDNATVIEKWDKDPIRVFANVEGDALEVLQEAVDFYTTELGGPKIVFSTQRVNVVLLMVSDIESALVKHAGDLVEPKYKDPFVAQELARQVIEASERSGQSASFTHLKATNRVLERAVAILEMGNSSRDDGRVVAGILAGLLFPRVRPDGNRFCELLDPTMPKGLVEELRLFNLEVKPGQTVAETRYAH